MDGNVRTREVKGKPGKFSATGNVKKVGSEESQKPPIYEGIRRLRNPWLWKFFWR